MFLPTKMSSNWKRTDNRKYPEAPCVLPTWHTCRTNYHVERCCVRVGSPKDKHKHSLSLRHNPEHTITDAVWDGQQADLLGQGDCG